MDLWPLCMTGEICQWGGTPGQLVGSCCRRLAGHNTNTCASAPEITKMKLTELRAWKYDEYNQLREIRENMEALTLEVRELRRELEEKRCGQPAPLMTTKDVAAFLRVSTRKVAELATARELVPLRIGGQNRYTPETIDAYLRATVKSGTRRRKRSIRH